MRLKAAAVLLLVLGGLAAGAAAAFGVLPAEPPAGLAVIASAMVAIKALAAIAGVVAFRGRRLEAV